MTTSRMQAVQSPVIPIVGELIRTFPGTISLGQGIVYYPPPPEATDLTQFLPIRQIINTKRLKVLAL
ncbi:hypothetical protein [Gloeocapsopsis crepidinum]|uniref:hypothetical protein n=1 Tax=Gloeocapsopsis crepidinum TaxID=693223 RepID=UPI003F6FC141